MRFLSRLNTARDNRAVRSRVDRITRQSRRIEWSPKMEVKMFALEVPASAINVESRDVVVSVDVAAIPHDVLRQVLAHGIKQKVADAASGVVGQLWLEVKGKDAPKPSRDQLRDFAEGHEKAVKDATLAAMQKAVDAMMAGQWQVRVAGDGTSTKWTDEQALALDIAKAALKAVFVAALSKAKPGAKATAADFVALSPKVAAFFKANESRPTWDDKAVMAWIKAQAEKEVNPRDIMAEARDELARRNAAAADMSAITAMDELLAGL